MKKKFTIIFFLSLTLISSSLYANSLYKKGAEKISRWLIGSAILEVAIGASIGVVIADYGLKEMEESAAIKKASTDAEDARRKGEPEYQVKVCQDENGNDFALPRTYVNCPFGDYELADGPLLKFPENAS